MSGINCGDIGVLGLHAKVILRMLSDAIVVLFPIVEREAFEYIGFERL